MGLKGQFCSSSNTPSQPTRRVRCLPMTAGAGAVVSWGQYTLQLSKGTACKQKNLGPSSLVAQAYNPSYLGD